MVTTNQDVAILNRLNDLAARYGLKPMDFEARIGSVYEGGLIYPCIEFHNVDSGNKKLLAMMAALGIGGGEHVVKAIRKNTLFDKVEAAMASAPQPPFTARV